MASTLKVDKIEGSTGSTITVPTGQTLTLTDGLASASLPVVGVAKGGTALSSFTAGDVLYATGATTLAKLAKGTAEQVLAMNSGATAPDWGSVDLTVLPTITVAKGGTNLTSFTAGDFLYATGATTLAKLAKGSALQVIQMNAGATAPEWVAASGGKTVKRHYFEFNTRTAGAGSGAQFSYTTAFTPVDPTAGNNDLFVQATNPMKGSSGDWFWGGMRFIKSGGSTYDYYFKGIQYVDPNAYQSDVSFNFVIPAGDIAAGTYTVQLLAGDAGSGSSSSYWALNTSDNAGVGGQTVCTLMITEFKN